MPHPPIGVAGLTPKSDTLALAGERGWIPMSINLVPTSTLAKHWVTYADAAQGAGRVPDRATWRVARDVYVGGTAADAQREAHEGVLARDGAGYFLQGLKAAGMQNMLKGDAPISDDDLTIQYMIDQIWVVGDVDQVTQQLFQLYQDVGGFGVLLVMGHEWLPRDKWVRSMTLLANEVIPRVNRLIA
jgi:alkanesulfonate monooxygenase SsuD/methylene tetrahydromethanopterin reductase-like flavin-dependent oxidoreductase (luciferase family)